MRVRLGYGRRFVRGRSIALAAGVVVAACGAPAPPIPDPPLDQVEAVVAQELRSRRAAVVAHPGDAESWGRFGMALDAHGIDPAAATAYERAAALDPDEFRWPYYQAALLEATSLEHAVEIYRRALAIRAGYAPAHLRLAQALERLGRRDEARQSFERAQQLEPDNPFAPLGLGSLALRAGDVSSAIALLERAYGLDPELHATVSALANAYLRAGDAARARRLALEARDLPRITYQHDELRAEIKDMAVDRRSHVRRAVTYRDVGQTDRALREARTARSVAPQDVQTVLLVADLEYRSRDYVAAEASAREAMRLAPDRNDVRELLARILYERGQVDEAATLAREVLDREESANMEMLLGRAAGRRGDDAEAIRRLERAVELRPQELEWRLALARLLLATGQSAAGRGHLLRVVEADGGRSQVWSDLGQSELDLGDEAAAGRAFERALATAHDESEREMARAGLAQVGRATGTS